MTTQKKINMGIIGYGFMGQTHATMIDESEYMHLVEIADIDPNRFKEVKGAVETYASADELLKNNEIETVIIAIPNHLHLDMVKKVADAKKDIIIEKPAAMNAKEFEEMWEYAKKAGVRFTIHHQRRFDKDYRIAKEIFDSNTLGKVYTIKSSLYGFNGNMHDWHIYPEYGGGMLYDWGVHLLDQMLWMIPGKLKTVFADVKNVINKDVDDYFNIQLYFENGITAQIELGTYFLNVKEKWFEHHWFIGGDKGSANIDGFNPKGSIVRTSELLTNVPNKISMTAAGPTRSFGNPPKGRIVEEALPSVDVNHKMYFDHYYQYVLGNEEVFVKPEEILRLMKLVDTIRISSQQHQSVDFE